MPRLSRFVSEHLLLLPMGAVIAMVWVNFLPQSYYEFTYAIAFAVNEVAMVLFFALVAKEVVEAMAPGGMLHAWRRTTVPVIAAAGATILPALLYADANFNALKKAHQFRLKGDLMRTRIGIRQTAGMMGAAVFITALLASSAPGLAQSSKTRPPDGAALYKVHCASCHGRTGRGDGPVAEFLKIPPTDLTQIASRARGVFPAGEVFRIIDGRQRVRAHGDSAMPVWGDGFSHLISGADGEDVRVRIDALVKYLDMMQARRASSTGSLPAIAQ